MAEKITKTDEWPITTKRFVAFIDIMGFKDMVARSTHNQIYKMMKKIEQSKNSNEELWNDDKDAKLVMTTTYSDSIMLYTKDDTYKSLNTLTCIVAGLTHDLFIEGIPHKGGVAFGEMTLDTISSIFFGQPLIDAYLLQEELNFYGIIVHATCEEKIALLNEIPTYVHNYFCPLKNGNSKHLTIQPVFLGSKSKDIQPHITKLLKSLQMLRHKTSGHLRKYIDNTETYFNQLNSASQ